MRPGTAEVIYKNMEDAVKAVDTYHNRQLDGQPMKCLLVKPRYVYYLLHISVNTYVFISNPIEILYNI